jgi:hypothetical protein
VSAIDVLLESLTHLPVSEREAILASLSESDDLEAFERGFVLADLYCER